MVGAEAPDQFELRPGSEADHLRTARLRKLGGEDAKSSARSGDQHGVAFLGLGLVKQDVGRNALHQYRKGKRMIQSGRKRNRRRSRDHGVSCISAALNDGRNRIALFETFHAFADAFHTPAISKPTGEGAFGTRG